MSTDIPTGQPLAPPALSERDHAREQAGREAGIGAASRGQQLTTFLSGNANLIVSVVVGLVLTRLMVQQLGLGDYGVVAFVLSIGSLVHVLGNALCGASSRFLTVSYARGESDSASAYLTNTLAIVAGGGCAISIAIYVYVRVFAKASASIPQGFVEVMLVSIVLSAVAGVLSAGNFVREKFVERNAIRIVSRIAYGAICALLLCWLKWGMWAVAVGAMAAAVVRLVAFHASCRRLLPRVEKRLDLVSRRHMAEVGAFVGWMVLAYCANYLIRSGVLLVVEARTANEHLGRFALAISVALLIRQGLGCLAAVTAPRTYKRIAAHDYRGATRQVEKFLFLAACLGAAVLLALAFEGDTLLRLWLGASAPADMTPLLLAAGLSAVVSAADAPISVFAAGVGKVRTYGIASLVGGIAVVAAAWVLLGGGADRLVWVAACPAVGGVLKNGAIVFLHRGLFRFSPARPLLARAGGVAALCAAGLVAAVGARACVVGSSMVLVAVRLAIMAVPWALLAVHLFAPRRRPHAAAPCPAPLAQKP